MQCKKEDYTEGSIFHFYNRTEKGKLLFQSDEDYFYFLRKFKSNITKYPCEVYAYCLMPNHFHFCLKQISSRPAYGIFNAAMMSYTLHYNYKYNCRGHLLEKRLQSKKLKDDGYLIQLCRYIHYNPVKAGLVEDIESWKYSNYLEIIGKRNGTMFSAHLSRTYPEEFENYAGNILTYQKYLTGSEFTELLMDGE
ncbi:MAG: transposase [Candidatus Cloacimonetes bacterium]|nr:transposase [Candidatus Cloacimonadota bacterium]